MCLFPRKTKIIFLKSVMSVPKALTMLGTSKIEALVSAAESGGAVSVIAESCGPRGGTTAYPYPRG
jgi:hypothetical protein